MTPKQKPGGKTRARSTPGSFERRVRACYPELPKSERRVADLLLNFPSHLATHSATELAHMSAASKAAVTRLIKRLGYGSFTEARNDVRDAQAWGSPIYLDQDAPGDEGAAPSILETHMTADVEVIRKTLEGLDQEHIGELVEALETAERILVIGYRNSALLAAYLRSQLGLLRSSVELAPMQGETVAEGLYGLGPRDLLFAVGFRRRVPIFLSALEVARRNRTRIALLTDPTGAPLGGKATWVIPCHCRGASIFDTYVAALSIINSLVSQLAARLGTEGRARLREIERIHEDLGDLS